MQSEQWLQPRTNSLAHRVLWGCSSQGSPRAHPCAPGPVLGAKPVTVSLPGHRCLQEKLCCRAGGTRLVPQTLLEGYYKTVCMG